MNPPTPLSVPWPRSVDRLLFGSEAIATFKRHSAEYSDFKDFYTKHRSKATSSSTPPSLVTQADEAAFAKESLRLFKIYQQKRRELAKQKMAKDRAALPIAPFEQQLTDLVKQNRVVLVAAATGAGKSTQVPQYLLAAGFDKIAVTQPRRIACFSLAKRVSEESLDALHYGSDVAFQVRFEGTKTANTKILFLTEGLLLRQFAQDNCLRQYNLIIVDEVHERHITGDFLLGVLKRILSIRLDLRIVLMSATINASLFANYFNAPIIEIPGRMFPVRVEYLPTEPEEDRNLVDERLVRDREKSGKVVSIQSKQSKLKTDPYLRILERIDQVVPVHERGDLLIFLSGMNEITTLADELRNYASFTRRWIILKLHSSLSVTEQEKVFDVAPAGIRKCILSTNIAETSVTIDGVRFIIDSGKVKEMSFDAKTRLSRLSEFWISQSSAKQRMGRAGRTGPGECFRFYTEREYERLNEFPVPEILRTPLEPLLLQTMAYGLGNPREFDFIERPDADVLESCMRRLQELGAVEEIIDETNLTTERERLTSLGKVLAILPMDVVLGKMLVLGSISDVVDAVIVMAAALTVPNPFVKVPDNRVDITERRNSLQSELGDPFTLLNLFSDWLKVKADGRESSKNWCKRYGVEEQRIYEMVKLKTQFEEVLAQYLGREQEDEIDSDEEEGKHNRRRGKKRIATSNRDGDEEMDEIERLKRRMFWKDPEFIKRKEQRLILEQQKREQASGKRKFLKFEDGDGENDDHEDGEEMENPKNMDDLSVHHLEFTLSHDPSKLLAKSDAANLSKRDANLVRLVICSGLWPHIAIADEANLYRPASEQVFHTKTKRFVKMLPTSIFSYKPEILHPKELATVPPAEGEKETLDTIRPKQEMTELLCYLELLETNKPYLTNVLRIPAAPACLLFAQRLDINQDMTHVIVDSWLHLHFKSPKISERILVLGNWLRTAWDHILGRRLKHVNHGLAKTNDDGHNSEEDEEIEEEIELMGTAVSTLPTETKPSAATNSENMAKKRIPSDWTDLTFLPISIKRVRYDWEMGTTRCDEGTLAGEEFESLTEYDLSRRLGEFCEIDFKCSVEKLRTQDIPNWFGFDPFKTDTSSEPSTNSNRFAGEILVTPYVHYFVSPAVLSKLSIKKKSKLQCSGPKVVLVEHSTQETEQAAFEPPSFITSDIVKDVPSEEAVDAAEEQGGIMMGCEPVGKKPYFCSKCGEQMQLSTIEILRHKKSCI